MTHLGNTIDLLRSLLPSTVAIVLLVLVLAGARMLLKRPLPNDSGRRLLRQSAMIAIWTIGLTTIILLLPFETETRGQLMGLIGALAGAAIALSSTTVLGNLIAGLMLRGIGNLRPGDFLESGAYFGRVTRMGYLHTEIQDEGRDLVTFPNLQLVRTPYRVVRSTATLVSATVSLGYDVPQQHIKETLCDAAEAIGLEDAFVWVADLGDFSVTYRVFGLLKNPTKILSTRAHLRSSMLDFLHAAGIEIVSPNFINRRLLDNDTRFIPGEYRSRRGLHSDAELRAESIMFDKASAAASIERLRELLGEVVAKIAQTKEGRSALKAADDVVGVFEIDERLERLANRKQRIQELIQTREAEADKTR